MLSPKTCAVLVPIHGRLDPETENSLRVLDSRGYKINLLYGSSDIALARCHMATQALRAGFEETLWVDADINFNPDDVDLLRAHQVPISAGLYTRKGRAEFAAKFKPGPLVFGKGGGLVEVEFVGMGFTHIRAEVYHAIQSKFQFPECRGGYDGKTIVPYFWQLFVDEGGVPCYLSEDYSFCQRAKASGFTIKADTTIKLGHVGDRYVWTWDEMVVRPELETLNVTATNGESPQ